MINIVYITRHSLDETSGGESSVSYNCYRQLCQRFDVNFGGHIELRHDFLPQYISKVRRRILRLPGNFDFYAKRRLKMNAMEVEKKVNRGCDAIFFKETTPWIGYAAPVPYFAYTDSCFHTYFFNTFDPRYFKRSELDRIWRDEAVWMENATRVFFETEWSLIKAKETYQLEGNNFVCVGSGGNVPVPEKDVYNYKSLALVSIARNFLQKGGDIIFDAYLKLREVYSEIEWHIIGAEPDRPWEHVKGIYYHGFLDKNNQEDLKRFKSVLEQAFVLVHPTREDLNPLVISEAGYFGCPSISVKMCAIPELVIDGENGILLDYPASAEALESAIILLIEDQDRYRNMRERAREHALRTATWNAVGNRIAQHMMSTMR